MAIAAVAGLASVGGAYATAVAAGVAFGFTAAATAFAIGAGLSIISRALMPKPDFGGMVNDSLTTYSPRTGVNSKSNIWKGQDRRVGRIYNKPNANKDLYLVIAFAGHGIEDYGQYGLTTRKCGRTAVFLQIGVPTQISAYTKVFRQRQTACSPLRQNDWTSTHVLNGIAYLRVKLVWDEDRKNVSQTACLTSLRLLRAEKFTTHAKIRHLLSITQV